MKHAFHQTLLAGLTTLSLALGSSATTAATVKITEVPPCGGGASQTAPIAGHIVGFEVGDRVVLWAITDQAYVQPFTASPFTAIEPDGGNWRNFTHLGQSYMAMIVKPGYQPPATAFKLPKVGGDIIAVDMVQCGGGGRR